MIVKFAGGIVAASGTLCKDPITGKRIIVTTRKTPSSNPDKIRMYIRSAASYQRRKAPSEKECQLRQRFKEVTNAYLNMTQDEKEQYEQRWKKSRYRFNGKTYGTLRGFIVANLYAEAKSGLNPN